MKDKLELIEERNRLTDRLTEIIHTGETEVRELNEGEMSELTKLRTDIEVVNEEIRKIENETKNENKNKEKRMEFNLLETIANVANGKPLNERSLEVIEAGKAECRKSGINYQGQIQLPVAEERSIAGDTVTKSEDKLQIMPALREKSVLANLGATFLTGLVGDIAIPKYSGSSVTWEGEVAAAKDGEGTFDSVKYSPKRLTAKIDISKQFLIQDSVGAEAMLKQDIVNALIEKLEATLLGKAAGSATQPAGLFNIVTPTASVSTYAKVVALESALESAKVMGEIKFALSPAAKATMKTTPTFTNGNTGIVTGNEMDGLSFESTGNIPANYFAAGKWSDYVVAQFGGLDITVDPYSQAANGMVRLVINGYFDAKPRRNESFVTASTGTIA